MSQHVELFKTTKSLNYKNFKCVNEFYNYIEDFYISYFLISYDDIFEDENVIFYSIHCTMKDKYENLIDYKFVDSITTNFDFALHIFDIISKNSVTPNTLKDCIYDILVSEF